MLFFRGIIPNLRKSVTPSPRLRPLGGFSVATKNVGSICIKHTRGMRGGGGGNQARLQSRRERGRFSSLLFFYLPVVVGYIRTIATGVAPMSRSASAPSKPSSVGIFFLSFSSPRDLFPGWDRKENPPGGARQKGQFRSGHRKRWLTGNDARPPRREKKRRQDAELPTD